MENTATPFSFSLGNTEEIEMTTALLEHFGTEEEIEKNDPPEEKPKKETKHSLPKPETEEKVDLITDKELEEELLNTGFESKVEEKEDTKVEDLEDEATEARQIYEDYKRLGLITEDAEVTTTEELLEVVKNEFKKGAEDELNAFLSSKGEKAIKFFQAVYIDGIDPQEYFSISQNIESVEGLDMENVDVQRNLVRRSLMEAPGANAARVDKYLKLIEEEGDLDKEAVQAQNLFLEREQRQIEKKKTEAEQKAKFERAEQTQYESSISNKLVEVLKTKDLAGLPFTDKIAENTRSYMTNKNWKLNGKELSDFDKDLLELRKPENIEKALKIAYLLQNDFDFSKIKNKAISEKTDKLFTKLTKKETEAKREQPLRDQFKISI